MDRALFHAINACAEETHTLRFSVFSTVVMNINALSVVVCIMLALAKDSTQNLHCKTLSGRRV
jgi:hypothetical protein